MKRYNNYDALRIISTIAVILIHANWVYFGGVFSDPDRSAAWIVMALINIVTRFSVPCFVMLSGAFILKNTNYSDPVLFYKRCLKKIIIPTAVAILLFCVIQLIINIVEGNSYYYGLTGVLTGNFYSLWFIYMLAGLYLLTPLIILLKETLSWKQYKVFAFMLMLWAIVSQATSSQRLAYSIGVCVAFVAYYILGDVLRTELEAEKSRFNGWVMTVICIACVAISFFWRASGHNYYTESAYVNFFSPTIVVYSICVFCMFGKLNVKKDWSSLSGITFEIYLFHRLVLKGMTAAVSYITQEPLIDVVILSVVTFVLAGVIGYAFKSIMKKLLSSKKLNDRIDHLKIWDRIS